MYIKVAIFPGKFDPINNGQLDVVKKASKLFDKLIILVINKNAKNSMFSIESRLQFIRSATISLSNVEVDYWPKPLSEYIKISHAIAIVRGVKMCSEFCSEIAFNVINEISNNDSIQTVFMMPNPKNIYIDSKLVKKLCILKKNLSSVVPKVVEQEIKKEV